MLWSSGNGFSLQQVPLPVIVRREIRFREETAQIVLDSYPCIFAGALGSGSEHTVKEIILSVEPTTIVIIGASGDLTSRKLVPSLYRLDYKKRLSSSVKILGMARSEMDDQAFRQKMAEHTEKHTGKEWSRERWGRFQERLHYLTGDATEEIGAQNLRSWLEEHRPGQGNCLFYLAVLPSLYGKIATTLAGENLHQQEQGWRRLIIEKPFGHDLDSARKLNETLRAHFGEDQIYRIDHYLGKETVQNMLALRFANILFEPVWNHTFIDHIQITVSESVTIEGRGAYYDRSGALRDMFQNHLLQLLTLVAMEAPARYAADTLRNEKVKVLDAIRPLSAVEAKADLVCGQYEGYHSEKGVEPESRTPTYAAMRLTIDNWRWHGVPFYLRSGKGMAKRYSEVIVQFRSPPHLMFPLPPGQTLESNCLAICLQPDEGIHVSFQTKVPGEEGMDLRPSSLEFHYQDAFGDQPIPEAYERLLLDGIQGDAALFMRDDEIERAWMIMDPFLEASERQDFPPPEQYSIGSMGPECGDVLLAGDGRTWLGLCANHESNGSSSGEDR